MNVFRLLNFVLVALVVIMFGLSLNSLRPARDVYDYTMIGGASFWLAVMLYSKPWKSKT